MIDGGETHDSALICIVCDREGMDSGQRVANGWTYCGVAFDVCNRCALLDMHTLLTIIDDRMSEALLSDEEMDDDYD